MIFLFLDAHKWIKKVVFYLEKFTQKMQNRFSMTLDFL